MNKFLLLIALYVFPVNAGVYKWTDKDGNVHFGDRPVNKETATELTIETNNAAGITNSSGNKEERDYLLKKIAEEKQARIEKRKKKNAENKKRLKYCNDYRHRLQNHIRSNSSFTTAANGERNYLSEGQRAERKKMLSKGVAKYCH